MKPISELLTEVIQSVYYQPMCPYLCNAAHYAFKTEMLRREELFRVTDHAQVVVRLINSINVSVLGALEKTYPMLFEGIEEDNYTEEAFLIVKQCWVWHIFDLKRRRL